MFYLEPDHEDPLESVLADHDAHVVEYERHQLAWEYAGLKAHWSGWNMSECTDPIAHLEYKRDLQRMSVIAQLLGFRI